MSYDEEYIRFKCDDAYIRFKYIENNAERMYKKKDAALRMWFIKTRILDWYRITITTNIEDLSFFVGLKKKPKWHYFKSLCFLCKNYNRIKTNLKNKNSPTMW